MIQWVYQAAKRALPRVVVATDDRRIFAAVRGFGGEALLTSCRHQSGTDRVAEVARRIPAQIYVNIQGDEPTMIPSTIQNIAKAMRDRRADMATAAARINKRNARSDRMDSAHLAVSPEGFALYFSRFPIPCGSSPFRKGGQRGISLLKHIGIYAYRKDVLLKLSRLPRSPLERLENLEQLRALENGFRIKVVRVRQPTFGVDRPGDIRRAERILRKRWKESDGALAHFPLPNPLPRPHPTLRATLSLWERDMG